MGREEEVQPNAAKRRVPLWIWDTIAALLLLGLWLVHARDETARAMAEGGRAEVSFVVPSLVVLYLVYRVGRKLIKGSAYPEGARLRLFGGKSFRLSR